MAQRILYLDGRKSTYIDLAITAQADLLGIAATPTATGYYAQTAFLYRCVDVRANALTSVPWTVTRGETEVYTSEGGIVPAAWPWLADLRGLLWQSEAALSLTSTAYWHKLRSGQRIIGLRWLQPDTMTPVWGAEPWPDSYKRQIAGSASTAMLPADDIVYTYLPGIDETVPRPSPAQAAAIAAGVLWNTDRFVTEYFKRGAIKATLLGVPADTPPQAKEELRAWYQRVIAGIRNAWTAQIINADAITPVVIGSGIDELSNNTLTNEKREDIATALGVPHSLVLSNAANFATAEADRLNFYETTILPESVLISERINRQLFEPLGLRFDWQPQEMAIYQEDEEQRAQAFSQYVGAGLKPSIVAQMLGLNLPDGVTPEMLDPEPEPPAAFVFQTSPRQLPGPVEQPDEAVAEEMRKLRRWAKGKSAPDVTKFQSAILSDEQKRAALQGDAVGAMPPFPMNGNATHDAKALLRLDPEDADAEERLLRKLEKGSADDIAKGLRDILKQLNGKLQDAPHGIALDFDIMEKYLRRNGLLSRAVERTVTQGASLGVNLAAQRLGQTGFAMDWSLVNTDAVTWARQYAGELIDLIDDSTLTTLRTAVASWSESGAPLPDLIAQLEPLFGAERAKTIATTEVTRSFAEANRQAYQASGVVEKMEWQTAGDELAAQCPICGPLHEVQRDLDEPFGEDVFGETMYSPPAHPNCRCAILPVISRNVRD